MRLLAVACLVLAPWSLHAGEAGLGDPWKGKPRAELVALLGEPAKVKTWKERESLFYSFVSVDPAAAPTDGSLLLYVPGVGLVAKILEVRAPMVAPPAVPLETDDQGRPLDGGTTRSTESVTISRDLSTGAVRRSPVEPLGQPPRGRKVKLRFDLDRDGRVERWSQR